MSSITGGIFSRPKGTTGGLVFGAARSRTGKVVTIREKVDPANPNTAGQVTQRTIFSETLTIVRTLGAAIYQVGWNRAIGQLPGFQSMMSVYMKAMDAAFDLVLTTNINLGILHNPDTFTMGSTVATELNMTWTAELGANGTAADTMVFLVVPKLKTQRSIAGEIFADVSKVRSDTSLDITGLTTGQTYTVYRYILGVGTAAGLRSIADNNNKLIT